MNGERGREGEREREREDQTNPDYQFHTSWIDTIVSKGKMRREKLGWECLACLGVFGSMSGIVESDCHDCHLVLLNEDHRSPS